MSPSLRALTLAPGESAVQSLYGVQIAAFGKFPQAITAMQKAIELDPLSGFAWANVGLFETVNRNCPAARRALDHAPVINPTNDSFHFALGQLDLLQDCLAEARAEFAKQSNEPNRRVVNVRKCPLGRGRKEKRRRQCSNRGVRVG